MKNRTENQSLTLKYEQLATLLIVSGIIIVVFGVVLFFFLHSGNTELLGQYGEFVGGIAGSIWTLAGVALFYSALRQQMHEFAIQKEQLEMQREELVLQRRELKLQREEAELQRLEFERQTLQLKEQNRTLSIQKFENTFFQLLGLQNQILSSNENSEYGKLWAEKVYEAFVEYFKKRKEKLPDVDELELIRGCYDKFKVRNEYLDRYFNNLFHILAFVDKSAIDENQDYAEIVRVQISEHQLLLLFYFCLSEVANPNFKDLVTKYKFLENIIDKKLIERKHQSFYSKEAFGKNYFDLKN